MSNNFKTESLIRAMYLPVDDVILNFKNEQKENWHTESAQAELASTIYKIIQPRSGSNSHQISFEPAARYIRQLLQSYARLIEDYDSKQIENDDLVELMMIYQYKSRQKKHGSTTLDDNVPNPRESCYVSFVIPNESFASKSGSDTLTSNDEIVGIKIYPHHNDVGVQKVWEAGAALTEFLIANEHYIRNKSICELGAGVGFTGIVIAGVCQTEKVHMTDYTNATLENLQHNCAINSDWINGTRNERKRMSDKEDKAIITAGYLEWDEFHSQDMTKFVEAEEPNNDVQNGNGSESNQYMQSPKASLIAAMNADVLIAADVIYDRSVIPQLVKVVRNILTSSSSVDKQKTAIFATTYRNADTFALFQKELEMCSDDLDCNFIDSDELQSMPYIFPCYYKQPRSHVRICIISVKR